MLSLVYSRSQQATFDFQSLILQIWFFRTDSSQYARISAIGLRYELANVESLISYVSNVLVTSFAMWSVEMILPPLLMNNFLFTSAIIDFNHNQIYLITFNTESISLWKIAHTNQSVMKTKETIDDNYSTHLAIWPHQSHFVAIFSNQSIVIHPNDNYSRCSPSLKITETQSLIRRISLSSNFRRVILNRATINFEHWRWTRRTKFRFHHSSISFIQQWWLC